LPHTIAPDPEYEAIERRLSVPEAAVRAIAQLPDSDREVLELRVVQERPYSEIAGRLSCTPQAARLRVSRTLHRLNLALEEATMTELHAGLDLYREQLREATVRDLHERRRSPQRRRLALRMAVPAAGAVAAGALAISLTGGTPVQSADAAILHRVASALTSPPATILHERALVTAGSTTQPYELWEETVPPYHYHVLKWGHSGTGTSGAAFDPAAELRSLVRAGKAHVVGRAAINGVAAYKLAVIGSADRFLNGTAYVAQSNYHPLKIDTTGNGGERIVFQTYQYLPATSANRALMRAAAR